MQQIGKSLISLPAKFPNKKILAFDIGGSLAKVAFYLPREQPQFEDFRNLEVLTKDCIPSKSFTQP